MRALMATGLVTALAVGTVMAQGAPQGGAAAA